MDAAVRLTVFSACGKPIKVPGGPGPSGKEHGAEPAIADLDALPSIGFELEPLEPAQTPLKPQAAEPVRQRTVRQAPVEVVPPTDGETASGGGKIKWLLIGGGIGLAAGMIIMAIIQALFITPTRPNPAVSANANATDSAKKSPASKPAKTDSPPSEEPPPNQDAAVAANPAPADTPPATETPPMLPAAALPAPAAGTVAEQPAPKIDLPTTIRTPEANDSKLIKFLAHLESVHCPPAFAGGSQPCLFMNSQIFDMAGKVRCTISQPVENGHRFEHSTITPDGKWLALHAIRPKLNAETNMYETANGIELFAAETGQLAGVLPVPPATKVVFMPGEESAGRLRHLIGLHGDRLLGVLYSDGNGGERIFVWSMPKGELVLDTQSDAGGPVQFDSHPSGKYLAMCNKKGLSIVELESGKAVVKPAAPRFAARPDEPFADCRGIAFSPDGNTLAGSFVVVVGKTQVTHLVTWDTKGVLLQTQSLPGPYGVTIDSSTQLGLRWLADGSGWLIAGRYLFDIESKKIVWAIPSSGVRLPHLLDNDNLAVHVSRDKSTAYAMVRPPLAEIRAALAANKSNQPARVRSGMKISVAIEVRAVESGTVEGTRDAFLAGIKQTLQSHGITVAADQAATLHLTYTEEPGKDANNTTAQADVRVTAKGSDEPIWKYSIRRHFIKFNPTGTPAEQKVSGTASRIWDSLIVPFYVPADASLAVLPIVTEL